MRKHSIKTLLRKTVSITLIMAMTTGVVNMDGIVKSRSVVKGVEKTAQGVEKENEVKVVKELKDERTKNSNTYLMSDGSKKLEWYGDDIRYKENGKWKDYDSSLKEIENKDLKELEKTDVVESNKAIAQYKMVNTEGNSKQYFPEELGKDTPIIMKKDKYEIAFSQKTEKGEMPKKSDGDYEVIYTGEDSKTQYISLNNGVKENVIFNSRPAENTITYEYVLNGMYMELDEKTNVIGIYDEKGKKKAYISSPYLCDSTGTNYSFNIKYDIKNNGDTWTVTEALDEKFLNSKDTKYPVTLDPTMYWTSKDTVDASNPTSGYPANYVIDGGNEMLVGKISEGFYGQAIMKWRGLEERLKNKFISLAVLNVDIKEVVGNPVINIYPVEENWDISQVTWNTKPSNSDELISSQTGFEQGKKYNLDVKKWVEKIAFGEIPETYGIALCTGTEENMSYMRICGTATNKAPMFVVDYFDPIDMNGKYYGDFNITGEYQEDTGKIDLNWEDYGDGSGKEVEEYMIATRKNDGDFKMVARTSDLEYSLDIDSDTTDMDVRLVAIRKDGKYLSNILSYSINSETGEENQDEAGTYSAVTRDTDGDGLEDGYEIWDFKTKWNTETEDSTETEPKYVQDSDGDGLPDGYEVFTLGTDPAVKNEDGKDSDGDGWSDVREYREGTDPWLVDSDFDEVYDPDDFGTVNPRKTDNPQNKGTDRLGAYSAQVHKGLYDYEYSEMEDGVKVTYIVNIYRGDTKKITTDYGDVTLNKVIKYFYDENGNNTAIVEENQNDINHTICITYTYDSDGNVTYICDQKTEYIMSYKNGDMKTLKVGDVELVNYESNITENSNILEQITSYGNGQKIRTVTTKSIDENGNSYTKKSEIYYCDDTQCSYVTEYDNEGRILKFIDCTGKEKISYDYVYSDDNITVARNDGFMKEVKNSQNVDGNITDKNISYTFEKNQGSKVTYQESQKTDMSDEDKTVTTDTLYNGDNIVVTSSDENKKISYEIYSQLCKKDILNSYQDEMSDTKISYNINAYGENKKYEYIYDLSGNITEIKLDGNRIYEYAYDVHGRLVKELDYVNSTGCVYGYTSTGNVVAKHLKKINSDGSLTNIQDIKYSYENGDWADQLTKYGNQKITYDSVGNPVKYHDGKKFEWIRGRELSKIILSDDSDVTYEYNQNGLRTHKETNITSTDYEWDEKKLIRETVTYKLSGRKYDIWYYYDGNGDIAGFEYNEISEMNQELNRKSIYYEKNMQGDVIGLIDSTGAKIASYAYDAWGNVVDTVCYEKNEIPYALNHITYRGYYFDNESGFYYLQSRYYDAEVGRFINADDVFIIKSKGKDVYKDNMYIYCNSNPVINLDCTGRKAKLTNKEKAAKKIIVNCKTDIIGASVRYGVNPAITAGVIYAEQVLNVNILDDLTDWLGYYGINTSVGIGQVRIGTAKMLEKKGYVKITKRGKDHYIFNIYVLHPGKKNKDVYNRLMWSSINIVYVAAYLKYMQDVWRKNYEKIASSPDILGTLYNTGKTDHIVIQKQILLENM